MSARRPDLVYDFFYFSFNHQAVACENGIESWLPVLQRNIAQTIQSELDHIYGCHDDDNDEDGDGVNQRLESNNDRGDNVDKSTVFTLVLKKLLPLPANWTIEANSDAVAISIKLMMSTLLTECFDDYVQGDKSALNSLINKLNSTVEALSEFLFAQTKIKIRRKNLTSRGGGDDNGCSSPDDKKDNEVVRTRIGDVNLNIAASLMQTPTPLQVLTPVGNRENDEKGSGDYHGSDTDYKLLPYQTKMIRNFVHLFMGEVHFVQKLKCTLELGYNLTQRLPFEWHIHPRFVLHKTSGVANDPLSAAVAAAPSAVQVVMGQHALDYAYQYQGVTNFVPSVPLTQERPMHRMICTMLDDRAFSYTLSSEVS